MNLKKRILITLGVGAFLLIIFFIVTEAITKYTGFVIEENSFEKCIKENNIILYINSEDVSETIKNIELKDYLNDIKIFNCLRDNQKCLREGIDSFPTWVIKGEKIKKDINLNELEQFSNCNLKW